jgi:adenylate kinase family enzyme
MFCFLARKLSTQIGDVRSIANRAHTMKRIAIIGTTGSGKSTLASALASKVSAPHTELDYLNWLPGWQERDRVEFRALVDEATSKPTWVIDGGYSEVRDLVWGRADTIIWLNYRFPRTMLQLLRRTYRRNISKEPCCNGNYESWRLSFSKDSIIVWLFKSYWKNCRNYPKYLSEYANGKSVHIFRSPKETQDWLNNLSTTR